jgi:hypothetical protein
MTALGTSQSTCYFVSHHPTLAYIIEPKTIIATKNHVKIIGQRDGNLGKYVVGGEA